MSRDGGVLVHSSVNIMSPNGHPNTPDNHTRTHTPCPLVRLSSWSHLGWTRDCPQRHRSCAWACGNVPVRPARERGPHPGERWPDGAGCPRRGWGGSGWVIGFGGSLEGLYVWYLFLLFIFWVIVLGWNGLVDLERERACACVYVHMYARMCV